MAGPYHGQFGTRHSVTVDGETLQVYFTLFHFAGGSDSQHVTNCTRVRILINVGDGSDQIVSRQCPRLVLKGARWQTAPGLQGAQPNLVFLHG